MKREPLENVRQYGFYVAFCIAYLLGLIVAALYIARFDLSSLMRLLVYPRMSIVVGFVVSAVPFVIYYILLRCSAYFLIFPVTFFRAFTFMYCFAGVSVAYADAGWLVRGLLLFADCFTVPLLLWYVTGNLLPKSKKKDHNIWFCLLYVIAIRCIDSFVVSPFAMRLLSF